MVNLLPPHGIKAIFFDLDGVLVDAADWHKYAFLEALFEETGQFVSDQEHLTRFNGLSTKRKLVMLVEDGKIPDEPGLLERIHRLKQEKTIDIIGQKCKPIQRVIDTVECAREIGHIAVVTNCSRSTCELMLKKSKLWGCFDFVITNNDVGGKIKPHPWPYLSALYHFGLHRGEALAIDDTQKGIMSALEAGCKLWHLRKFEHLSVANLDKMLWTLRFPL